MTEEFNEIETLDEVKEVEKTSPGPNKGCRTVLALLVALILLFSAAVPLTRFLMRKSFERQVEEFPKLVCENLSQASQSELVCDASLGIVDFVPKTFPLGASKDSVASAMAGVPFEEQTAPSQPNCQQPTLWTYLVASSSLGWKTEVEFLFCSGTVVERTIFINGTPVNLPTYDL